MSDRYKGLTVTLNSDMTDDQVRAITDAIQMIKGVAHVERHVTDMNDHFARRRVRVELAGELGATFDKVLGR